MKRVVLAAMAALSLSGAALADDALKAVIAGKHRDAANAARDAARHPYETLTFFGVKPNMTVVELWPGGGWYTEILAPYLKDKGQYVAATFDESAGDYFKRNMASYKAKLEKSPELYGKVKLSVFHPPAKVDFAPAGSVDLIVTFRNVHNWMMNGGDAGLEASFKAMHAALKKGGVLGVVDHRLPANQPAEKMKDSGYMHEAYVIAAAEKAGFKLAGKSEINANAKDTADHPRGVWTLPPTLSLKDQDKDKYLAIGESDRMTLKFVKP